MSGTDHGAEACQEQNGGFGRKGARNFAIGDFFSGAGTFHLVVQASLAAFEKILPIECTDELEARFTKSLRCKL